MRQLGKARSHGRSPPRGAKGEIDEASALNGVHRSIVRFVERQVVGVFRIGSASQNKGLINRRK
jgi:cob(I)alamin adenosyltransferase